MALQNYIEKLRTKPVREREKIAVIATAVSFAIIFLIWLVSFNEMNRPAQSEAENQPSQLEDLKSNFSSDKASIEEMFRELPQESELEQSVGNEEETEEMQSGGENVEDNQIIPGGGENKAEVPQLP